jgi:hypothetical protein
MIGSMSFVKFATSSSTSSWKTSATFTKNIANVDNGVGGGAIYNDGTLTVNGTFGNKDVEGSGNSAKSGGAIYNENNSSPVISNCRLHSPHRRLSVNHRWGE